MNYVKARLSEHSTQVALSAVFGSLIAAFTNQITWSAFGTVVVGSLPAILMPAK